MPQQDWFTANAPKKADTPQGNWFAANAPVEEQEPPQRTWSDRLGLNEPTDSRLMGFHRGVGSAAVDLAEGVKAGALSTIYHGGDLIRRGLGMERVIERPDVQRSMTPPKTAPGRIGFYGEQAAEFTVPLAKVARVTKGAPILQRMAVEGAASAGVAGVQSGGEGENMVAAGVLGAAAPPVAAAVRGGVNMARNAAAGAREGGLGGAVAAAVRNVSPPEARMMLVQGLKPANKQVNFMRVLDDAMPEIKAAEQSLGKPIESIDDLIGATQTAKKALMAQYNALSGGQKAIGALVDGTPIAEAMVKSIPTKLKLENPKAAAALIEKADTYRRQFGLDDLEKLLVETNAELDGFYSQFPFAQRTKLAANPQAASLEAQARAMRDAIYKTLDAPGEGGAARMLKRRYGALMEVEQTAMRRANVAKRQQPESLAEQLSAARAAGEIAKGTYKILRGDVMGAADIAAGRASREAAKFLKEQQTTDALIRRAFAGFKGTPKPIPMPQQRPIRGLLPKGPMVTPPPADTSYVRSIPAEYGKP